MRHWHTAPLRSQAPAEERGPRHGPSLPDPHQKVGSERHSRPDPQPESLTQQLTGKATRNSPHPAAGLDPPSSGAPRRPFGTLTPRSGFCIALEKPGPPSIPEVPFPFAFSTILGHKFDPLLRRFIIWSPKSSAPHGGYLFGGGYFIWGVTGGGGVACQNPWTPPAMAWRYRAGGSPSGGRTGTQALGLDYTGRIYIQTATGAVPLFRFRSENYLLIITIHTYYYSYYYLLTYSYLLILITYYYFDDTFRTTYIWVEGRKFWRRF